MFSAPNQAPTRRGRGAACPGEASRSAPTHLSDRGNSTIVHVLLTEGVFAMRLSWVLSCVWGVSLALVASSAHAQSQPAQVSEQDLAQAATLFQEAEAFYKIQEYEKA